MNRFIEFYGAAIHNSKWQEVTLLTEEKKHPSFVKTGEENQGTNTGCHDAYVPQGLQE